MRFLVIVFFLLSSELLALEPVLISGQIFNSQPFVLISVSGSNREELFFVDSGTKESLVNEMVAKRWQREANLPAWMGWTKGIPFLGGEVLYSTGKWEQVPLQYHSSALGSMDFFVLAHSSDLKRRLHFRTPDDRELAGILGADFLSRCEMAFDRDEFTLRCQPDSPVQRSFMELVIPTGDTTITATVDTGSGYAMTAFGPNILAKGFPMVTNSWITMEDSEGGLRILSVPDLPSSPESSNRVAVQIWSGEVPAGHRDLLIGLPYFQGRKASIDFVHRTIHYQQAFEDSGIFSRHAWDAQREGSSLRFSSILPGSYLARMGVLPGDLVEAVNATPLSTAGNLKVFMETLVFGEVKTLQVSRDGMTVTLSAP